MKEFKIFKLLSVYNAKELHDQILVDDDNICEFINDIYELSKINLFLKANLGMAFRVQELIKITIENNNNSRLVTDQEMNNICNEVINISNEAIVSKESEKEYFYFIWSSNESKKRGISKNNVSSLAYNFCCKDDDILYMLYNNPKFLEIVDMNYVLATINKIINVYPDLLNDVNLYENVNKYLESVYFLTPHKYKKYYRETITNLQSLKNNKSKVRVISNEKKNN